MATPERGKPDEEAEPQRTPPMQLPGRALWRGFVIVSIFVFASMLLLMVVGVGHDSWLEWWTELLIVPGFVLGLVVAVVDFIRQRGRERE